MNSSKLDRIAPVALIAIFSALALKGGYDILRDGMSAAVVTYTLFDVLIVVALLRRTSPWPRRLGLLCSALYASLGAVAVLLGLWRLMSATLGGFVLVAIGLLAIGLGFWTITVLRKASLHETS